MYFISKGDCIVNVKDRFETTHVAHRLLVEGDHFGEIALIYNCKRTVSVISRNFNTMASLNKTNFRNLIVEIPNYKEFLI